MSTSVVRRSIAWSCLAVLTTAVSLAAPPPAPHRGSAVAPLAAKSAPAFERLDASLNRVMASADPFGAAVAHGLKARDGRLQVWVVAAEGATRSVETWLLAQGATRVSTAWNLVQADVELELLPLLAEQPDVLRVRRPSYVFIPEQTPAPAEKTRVLATTEGVQALNADDWHAAGLSGQGVKVGVIDAEFGRWDQLSGSELPPSNRLHFQDFSGAGVNPDGVHGTACGEVINDLAPSAEMWLAQVGTPVDIANAVSWMRNNNVKVISMSLGWLSWGPGDGTGDLANVINSFVNAGGVWVNSAGNSALAHYQARFTDGNGNQFHDFASGWEVDYVTGDGTDPVWITAGTTVSSSLIWNQWSSPTTDLDFFLYRWDGTNTPEQVAASDDPQNGTAGQLPIEEISFEIQVDGYYGFVVQKYAGSDVDFEFFNRFDTSPLQYNVQQGSLTPPCDAAGAIAAAAIDVTSFTIEAYSSRGPTNGPGGALNGGTTKPDLSSFANVSTAAYGPGAFSGTSSACPHIAGAATLAWSGYTSYTGAQVRSYLESHVVDMGSGGKDTTYGHGRLLLGAPPSGGCTYSLSQSSASFSAAGGSGQVSVSTQSGCGWTATSQAAWISVTGGASGSGNGTVTYSVQANSSASSRTGTLTIAGNTHTVTQQGSGGGGSYVYWVPAVTHASGTAGSQWRADVGALNRGSAATSVAFTLYASGQTYTASSSNPIAAGAQAVFADLVGQLQLTVTGHLKIEATQPLTVTARIFNQATTGTFGQGMDGFVAADGLSAGQEAFLPQLSQSSSFRTNIGFTNMSTSSATVTVTLYRPDGTQVGSFNVDIPAGQWRQDNEPFRVRFNQNNLVGCFAKVRVVSGSGVITYASVVDNATNDPTTVAMKR